MPTAYVFTAHGGPEVEAFLDLPRPVPGPGQLLITVDLGRVADGGQAEVVRSVRPPVAQFRRPQELKLGVPAARDADQLGRRGRGVAGPDGGERADRIVGAVDAEDRLGHRAQVSPFRPALRDRLVKHATTLIYQSHREFLGWTGRIRHRRPAGGSRPGRPVPDGRGDKRSGFPSYAD